MRPRSTSARRTCVMRSRRSDESPTCSGLAADSSAASARPAATTMSGSPRGVRLAIVLLLCPQPARGEVGPLAQRAELRPRHALLDQLRARECAEATVDAGDDAAAIADRLDDGHDAVRHDLRMLDDVGRGVDDAGHEQHPIRQRMPAKYLQLVLMARAR